MPRLSRLRFLRTNSTASRGRRAAAWRATESLEQRVLLTAPVAADWDFGGLSAGTVVTIDATDIVSEFGTDADGDLPATAVTFGTATVDGVPAGSLADVGFVYLPGDGTAGVFSIDTNASAFAGLSDTDEAAVVIGFTVSDGTESGMGEFSYQVDGENFGDFDFEIFFLGDETAGAAAMADDVAEGVLIDVTIAIAGPADISDIVGGDIELNVDLDGATGPALDDPALTIAIASAFDGSIATATASDAGKALAFANDDGSARAAAAGRSRADAFAEIGSLATAAANIDSAASARASDASDAQSLAENGSAADADATNMSSAGAAADNSSVATATTDDSSTSVATADVFGSATAITAVESVASADAQDQSIATAFGENGSAATATASNVADAQALATDESAAEATASDLSSASATADETSNATATAAMESTSTAVADAVSSGTAFASGFSMSNAEATRDSIANAVSIDGTTATATASDSHASTATSNTEDPGIDLSVRAGFRSGSPSLSEAATEFVGSIAAAPGSLVPLPIASDESDGETIDEVVISGLPAGSVLSAGTSNGDGTEWTFGGPPPINLTLTPPVDFVGAFSASVSTQNGDATSVASLPITIMITCASVMPGDGVHQLGDTLVIAGTDNNDLLRVQERNSEFRIRINRDRFVHDMDGINRLLMCGFGGTDKLVRPARSVVPGVLDGGDGNDRITGSNADETLIGGSGADRINAKGGDDVIDGGDGADRISAGTGNDIVLAGDGNDSVGGGKGRDILFGDDGTDRIKAGSGEDILIGGSTDLDLSALQSILAEWTSGRSYEQRAANISNDSPGTNRENGTNFLTTDTITDTSGSDKLAGSGGTDLFFANSSDLLSGRKDFEGLTII